MAAVPTEPRSPEAVAAPAASPAPALSLRAKLYLVAVAAVLLLPPEMVALIGVIQHIPEWLKHRYAWYIQTFNICNYTLTALAASWAAHRVLGVHPLVGGAGATWAVA